MTFEEILDQAREATAVRAYEMACTTRSTALHCWPVHGCQPHV